MTVNSRTIVAALLVAAVVCDALALAGAWAPAEASDRPGTKEGSRMEWNRLTPAEARIIENKGTELPFTGKYWNHHDPGVYRCRRCGAPLFPSSAKFDSGTGWPSFDAAFPGAVREVPDADGMRTEIVCERCGAHLGHLFKGEGFTARNARHCVNSVSLDFAPASSGGAATADGVDTAASGGDGTARARPPEDVALAGTCANPGDPSTPAVAYFAGGCFWGVEYWFDKAPGVLKAESGYMGGTVDDPSYEQVSRHLTGHAEAVRVTYDPTKTTYEALAKLFFDIHDPTQVDRQGPDVGPQYRSEVFYVDDAQRQAAQTLIDRLQRRGMKVATRLTPAAVFWRAEEYHQDYYRHKGGTPYCHAKTDRFGDSE